MEKAKVSFYLKTISKIFTISCLYANQEGIIASYQPFSFDGKENQFSYIMQRLMKNLNGETKTAVYFDINRYLVLIGIIALNLGDRKEIILIGPIASTNTTDENVRNYLFDSGLSLDGIKIVSEYMKANKRMNFDQFLNLLSSVSLVLTDQEITSDKFINISKNSHTLDNLVQSAPVTNRLNHQESETPEKDEERENISRKFHFCMLHGLVELLPDLLNQMSTISYDEEPNEYFSDEKENSKIQTIGALFAAEQTAIEAHVPSKTASQLKYYFMQKINASRTVEQLHSISVDILFEYTKMIRDHRSFLTENPTINRVIQYIQANLSINLTVDDIAKALHVSSNYIFTRFKREMNMTVLEYITMEKIKKAEYYLRFTDKSLIEISEYLGFSSQCYFQTVFKKVKNMTPNKYRETYGNEK